MVNDVSRDKTKEREEILKRVFPRTTLFEIGRSLEIPYFRKYLGGWDLKVDEASREIALHATMDDKLKKIFEEFEPRRWSSFRGRYYTFDKGELLFKDSTETVQEGIRRISARYSSRGVLFLKRIVVNGGMINTEDIKNEVNVAETHRIIQELENLGILVSSYKGDKYQEWIILRETMPLIETEMGIRPPKSQSLEVVGDEYESDPLFEEKQLMDKMDHELNAYLNDLIEKRLKETIDFGKEFNIVSLSSYLKRLFGPVLFFDSLLSVTQQYSLADVPIAHDRGLTGRRTGWSLALFGDPGTGKSFSTRDMILGRLSAKIPPHGIPGRNRYCGGMTPARFIRIGQSYAGRTFNFIVPEFNDFFKYKGMVEPLKLAMEQGEIKYELHREVIGPYKFTSFFSVNYNVSVLGKGYAVTIQDPNFEAIEDRMLCRLHRLTKERFTEIANSQMRLALGDINIEEEAQKIRDHLTLVYAIETEHPLVKKRFPRKSPLVTREMFEELAKTRQAVLEEITDRTVKFSARLEDIAVRFACASSLMGYFASDSEHISVEKKSIDYAIRLYVEEASVRSQEIFKTEELLKKLL